MTVPCLNRYKYRTKEFQEKFLVHDSKEKNKLTRTTPSDHFLSIIGIMWIVKGAQWDQVGGKQCAMGSSG